MSDFNRPTLSQLIAQARNDLKGRMQGADSFLPRSLIGVLALVWAGLVYGIYGNLAFIIDQFFPDKATGVFLTRWAAIYGLIRKAAVFAQGVVTVTGVAGSPIDAGTILQRSDGVTFETLADVELAGASTVVTVRATSAGVNGNTLAGASLSFTSPVSGVASDAIVSTQINGGGDDEKDEPLRARLLNRIRNPPQGGAVADYKDWAGRVAGVTRTFIYPLWMGPNTVGVTFVMDDRPDIIPTADDLAAVLAYIEPRKPVCADTIVFAPIPDTHNYTMTVSPSTPAVKAAVAAQMIDFYTREAEPGGTIVLSRINEAISAAPGETDHAIIDPVANREAAKGHMPILGTITWV